MREKDCERCPVGETYILRLERFDSDVIADASRTLLDAARYPTLADREQAGRYWPIGYADLVDIAGETAKAFAEERRAAEAAERARDVG